jgi:WD40 repeat protein
MGWDLNSHQPVGPPLPGGTNITSLDFSHDGKLLAMGTCQLESVGFCREGAVYLWNTDTLQQVGTPFQGYSSAVSSLAFSRDDRLLASGSCAQIELGETTCTRGEVRLWDISTQSQIGPPLSGHAGDVNGVAFSADDQTLASSSGEAIILWDISSRQMVGRLPSGPGVTLLSLVYSPDGSTLATGSLEFPPILWKATPQSWMAGACSMANRNLSLTEWQSFFGSKPYHSTCPGLPPGDGAPTSVAP